MAKVDDLNSTPINFWSAEWMLPDDLYAQFLRRLGSHELAAAALQQMVALDARVKAGAVQILPDRQAQHFPLRPEFLREKVQFVVMLDWQYDKDFGIVPGTMHKRLQVNVTEPGTWRLFLWREDADALFEPTKREAPALPISAPPAITEDAQRDGPQLRRVGIVMRKLYPPDGKVPDSVKTNVIDQAVGEEFQKRGWGTVSRDTIEFFTKRGRYKT